MVGPTVAIVIVSVAVLGRFYVAAWVVLIAVSADASGPNFMTIVVGIDAEVFSDADSLGVGFLFEQALAREARDAVEISGAPVGANLRLTVVVEVDAGLALILNFPGRRRHRREQNDGALFA